MAAGDLTPEDFAYFDTGRRRVRDQYSIGLAQNQYQQGQAQNTYGRSLADTVRQWDQMREKIPYSYAQSGLLNSGIAQRGYSNYAQDRTRALSNLQGQYQDQMGGLQLAQSQLGQVQSGSLADLDAQDAARRATIAAMLRGAQ